MFSSFTDPYDDEILYSAIARYHHRWPCLSYKAIIKSVFGKDTVIPTVGFPCHLDYLARQFTDKQYNDNNYFLLKHTLLPIYIPFLTDETRNKIIYDMKFSDGKGIFTILGLSAGGICKKEGLFYCPCCVSADVETYGEAYFHRVHQIQGVIVCPEHGCLLKKYKTDCRFVSRLQYIRLDHENVDYNVAFEPDEKLSEDLLMVANSAKYILNKNLLNFNIAKVFDKYITLLKRRQLLTIKGAVRQASLYEEFKSYYNDALLDRLQSNFCESNESNWLKNITRKQRRLIHPIRHILFIQFLTGNIEDFFNKSFDNNPFNKGPWPCLNPAAKHYMHRVINECIITADYVTRKPVGTFTCSCGFVYSRKGPNKTKDDELKIGRVKSYGEVWENKLKSLVEEKKYSLNGLAQLMKCDPKTIVKYAQKNGVLHFINTSMKPKLHHNNTSKYQNKIDYEKIYTDDILRFINDYPEYTKTKLKEILKKQYSWLYSNDREWLENNLPRNQSKINTGTNKTKINWHSRDIMIRDEIEKVYYLLKAYDKPVRITKSLLGKTLGKSALLENYSEKLPITEKYLNQIVETVEDFQIRRVDYVCEKLYAERGYLKEWEIIRAAGLRKGFSVKVENKIVDDIEKYNRSVDYSGEIFRD